MLPDHHTQQPGHIQPQPQAHFRDPRVSKIYRLENVQEIMVNRRHAPHCVYVTATCPATDCINRQYMSNILRCCCDVGGAAVGSGGLSGFRLDETSEITVVSTQTRPNGGVEGDKNCFMGLSMFSHQFNQWSSLVDSSTSVTAVTGLTHAV